MTELNREFGETRKREQSLSARCASLEETIRSNKEKVARAMDLSRERDSKVQLLEEELNRTRASYQEMIDQLKRDVSERTVGLDAKDAEISLLKVCGR